MLSFLKVFARGIICTVLLPLIIAVWVLYGVYCLVVFMVMLVKSIILFFAGDNAAGEMKEDLEAQKILLEREQAEANQKEFVNLAIQSMSAQQQMMQQAMGQQMMPQQPVFPQQPAQPMVEPQPQNDFNPFGNENEPASEVPSAEEPTNVEGEGGNDQSY